MVFPEGFALPPLPYLVGLIVGVIGVAGLVYLLRLPVTNWTVVALAPWMATGGVLHGLERLGVFPEPFVPLFEAPAVYATLWIITGLAWVISGVSAQIRASGSTDRTLGIVGISVVAVAAFFAVYEGATAGTLDPFWPVVGLVASVLVAAVMWVLLSLSFSESAMLTGGSGVVVVFAHTLDGISTAIGYDVLGAHERTPTSQTILETAGSLPTAEVIGAGWLFVLVKLALAGAIVVLFREYMREEPTQARLLLALVASVGLGPGVQNLLLFAVGG